VAFIGGALVFVARPSQLASQTLRLPALAPAPRIAELSARVPSARLTGESPRVIAEFWGRLAREGAPIIDVYPADSAYMLVTFVYRDTAGIQRLVLTNGVAGWLPELAELHLLEGTDIWYRSIVLPKNVRISYGFEKNGSLLPFWADTGAATAFSRSRKDPLNPNTDSSTLVAGTRSKLVGPAATPQPFVIRHPSVAAGRVDSISLESGILRERRRAWVYTPAGFRIRERLPLLVLFDGGAYLSDAFIPTATILDNMIAQKKIPPIVAVFVDNPVSKRRQELECNAAFSGYVVTELLPSLRASYGFTDDPKNSAIGGSSHGALESVCTVVRYPGVFGHVISQSGSYWWAPRFEEPEWPARTFAVTKRTPERFYMDVGGYEIDGTANGGPGQVVANRHFRDILRAKGYDVSYQEFPGAHEYFNWRGTLSTALTFIFAPGK
jgi:enterochelin esterase-like enzyme